jgi:carotenoid cleavage dioxygenase
MHYGVVDRHNKLQEYIPVKLRGPRLPHDMAISENYAILNDLPSYWDEELIQKGIFAARFHANEPSRFAILPRRGARPEDIKWFEAAPTYVLHWLNAYEEGDEIVLDGYFQENPIPPPVQNAPAGYGHALSLLDLHSLQAKLHRWRFHLKTGKTKEERLSDRVLEFGMINQLYAGRDYRYVYSALGKPGIFLFNGLAKHDLKTGQEWLLRLPEGEYASEAPFIPKPGGACEDDGYLVTFTINEKLGVSDCLLIDARDLSAGPICRIRLPHKISSGTHATWASREFIRNGFVVG